MLDATIIKTFNQLGSGLQFALAKVDRAEMGLIELVKLHGVPHAEECAALIQRKAEQNGIPPSDVREPCGCTAQGLLIIVQAILSDRQRQDEAKKSLLVRPG